jgi:hypothetical protein
MQKSNENIRKEAKVERKISKSHIPAMILFVNIEGDETFAR